METTRKAETDSGIQDKITVRQYDSMQRRLRDKGMMETDGLIASGIDSGRALEIGPGPGYLGLEWLSKTGGTGLTACEISDEMIKMAEKNAETYGLSGRAVYVKGNAMHLPFDDGEFDAVFSNGSLHEWENPVHVFNEAGRVLKPGGRFFISDLRRDISIFIRWMMIISTKEKTMKSGLLTSLAAAYTKKELEEIARDTALSCGTVSINPAGLALSGVKN